MSKLFTAGRVLLGAALIGQTDTVLLYYGAADTSLALATGGTRQMLRRPDEHGSEVGAPEVAAAAR